MSDQNLSVKHVRRNCLECSGGLAKCVTWCTCDGLHSIRCEFWPFRFGVQPATFRARYGDRLLTPEKMPPANVNLDELPGTLEEAAFSAISVMGYEQPAVAPPRRSKRALTARQRQELRERLRKGKERKRACQRA